MTEHTDTHALTHTNTDVEKETGDGESRKKEEGGEERREEE